MEPSTPRCSIVVRSHNEEAHIGRLLAGLLGQTVQDVQIIVVDSGSTDRTVEIAQRYPVEIVPIEKKEFSFGRSLNRGCQHARADFVVIASAHVYPLYDDWLERLLAPFADPAVALVYGKQRGAETSRFSERQIFRSWFPARSAPHQQHPFCNNANAAIRRSVWERIPYDETLTGLEDLAWAGQAMSLGHRIVYEAAAEIVHVHDETWRQILNRYRREAIAMKKLHPDIRFRFGDFLRLTALNVANDLRTAAREGQVLRYLQEIVLFRTMQFWGAFRGYSQHGPVSRHLWMRFYYPGEEKQEEDRSREAARIEYEAQHR